MQSVTEPLFPSSSSAASSLVLPIGENGILPAKTGISQEQLDMMARDIAITAEVIDNLRQSSRTNFAHGVRIEFHKRGKDSVPSSGWKLFFHNLFLLFPSIFPRNNSTVLDIEKLRITMHGGTLYSLEPVESFKEIQPDETRVFELDSSFWSVARTDFMPYWYFVSTKEGTTPRIAEYTEDMSLRFVKPFKDVRQWKRHIYDRYNPFTPQERMRRLQVNDTGRIEIPIIPTPLYINIKPSGSTIIVGPTWKIYYDDRSKLTADYLADKLSIPEASVTNRFQERFEAIFLSVGTLMTDPEGYGLRIDPDNQVIEIMSHDEPGVFYGVQSLLSLMKSFPDGLRQTDVNDKPSFHYRGMHVDVARHFVPSHEIMRLMDVMAMYKLNKLHLHLANDEGVRLYFSDLPELTEIGADRCHDLEEKTCIKSQLGTGPFEIVRRGRYGWTHEHYRRRDYRALLEYANSLYIEVIPEFEMPAHAHAAIKAMEARYDKYSKTNLTKAEEFRLIDPDDTSMYISAQWWMDNVMNPCIESTYRFITIIVDTLVQLHEDIQPLKTFHFGGDEMPKGALTNSTKCQDFLAANPKYQTVKDLKRYFVERVAKITSERGVGLRSWEDGLMDKNGQPFPLNDLENKDVSANDWNSVWEWGNASGAYKLANAGYKVIMSHATHLYFDHPHEPDPEERGLYWATRFTNTRKTFSFMPDSMYDNIDVKRSGEPLTAKDVCGADFSKCVPLLKEENIIGMQGHLWTETVRTYKEFEHMIYPRLLALAERAWHKAEFEADGVSVADRKRLEAKEWEQFANTLGYKELQRLDDAFDDVKDGVFYRVPPPAARVVNGKLEVSVTFPGLVVEYSKDSGKTWNEIIPGSDVFWEKSQTVLHLRTRSAAGERYSRIVELFEDEPLEWTDQSTIDYIAANLQITAGVVDNLNKIAGRYVTLFLKLHNLGDKHIHKGTWKLYFHSLYRMKEDDLDCGLKLEYVSGDLYSLALIIDSYPGHELICTLYQELWNVARTDFLPNWYVYSLGMVPKVINNTKDTLDFVQLHHTPQSWKRGPEDQYNPLTTIDRFNMYKNGDDRRPRIPILPEPFYAKPNTDEQILTLEGWVVLPSLAFEKEARYLAEKLKLPITSGQRDHFISFLRTTLPEKSNEAYDLVITPTYIIVQAEGQAGAFYGAQSLVSLWEAGGGEVPILDIKDKPRFGYRGVMIDTARNFKPKEWMYKILNVMVMYKMNMLHFRLSDDEAWRLEIPGIPELTEMGANRCQNHDRDLCLIPQRGTGPDKSHPGSGFYTVQDYQDILQYAADRHIVIIPEIDMPGHSKAAVASMEYRKSKIENIHSRGGDVSTWKTYSLLDQLDKPRVKSFQKWTANIMNPCISSTYEFIDKVLDELIIMHKGIKDLGIFSIGGIDKLPEGVWENSPACSKTYNSTDTTTIRKHFVKKVADIMASKNMNLMAWGDVFYEADQPTPITEFKERNVYTIAWNNAWDEGQAKRAAQFADEGYKVILGSATHLFLDTPYEPDPEESGLYWASRYTDEKKIFGFTPDDIFASADVNIMGQPVSPVDLCEDKGCPKTSKPHNIIGMQGILFSDLIRTEEQMHHALFPRLLVVADKAWRKPAWESIADQTEREVAIRLEWDRFASKVGYNELPRLEKTNIHFRVPPPGGRIIGDILEVNTLYPNLLVDMSTNNGRTWHSIYKSTFLRIGRYKILLRARSRLTNRLSRIVSLQRDFKRQTVGIKENLRNLKRAKMTQKDFNSKPGRSREFPILRRLSPSS